MAPWAKPIIDNLDFIMRPPPRHDAVHQPGRRAARRPAEAGASSGPTVEDLLGRRTCCEIAPINYLRGRSIHDAAIIVDDGQNLTQEDMKLVLTRAGEGTRVILTGDPDQIDRAEIDALSNGLVQVVERFKGEPTLRAPDHERSRAVADRGARSQVAVAPPASPHAPALVRSVGTPQSFAVKQAVTCAN